MNHPTQPQPPARPHPLYWLVGVLALVAFVAGSLTPNDSAARSTLWYGALVLGAAFGALLMRRHAAWKRRDQAIVAARQRPQD